jgi:Fibronectin type III domain
MRSVRIIVVALCASVLLLGVLSPAAVGAPFTVSSTAGWQTALNLTAGQHFTISYVSGQWTVDTRRPDWGFTGIDGYPPAIDEQILQAGPGCKVVGFEPFGTLLGMGPGPGDSADRIPMGDYIAGATGPLLLRINDADPCLGDNGGSITVDVSTPPAQPAGLTATAVDTSTVRLNWLDKATDENGFWIYVNDVYTPPNRAPDTTSTDVGGLQPGTTYCFKVEAFNAAGGSGQSAAACATTHPVPVLAPQPLAAPTGLVAKAMDQNTIRLQWFDNADGETSFEISNGTTARVLGLAVPGHGPAGFDWTGLTAGTRMCFEVRAVNSVARSNPSAQQCATTLSTVTPAGTVSGNAQKPIAVPGLPIGGPGRVMSFQDFIQMLLDATAAAGQIPHSIIEFVKARVLEFTTWVGENVVFKSQPPASGPVAKKTVCAVQTKPGEFALFANTCQGQEITVRGLDIAQWVADWLLRAVRFLNGDADETSRAAQSAGMRRLARDGGFTQRVSSQMPGRLSIVLTTTATPARQAAAPTSRARTLAHGRTTFTRPGSKRLSVRLTRAGKRLFRRAGGRRRVRVLVSFTPAGSRLTARRSRTTTLTR